LFDFCSYTWCGNGLRNLNAQHERSQRALWATPVSASELGYREREWQRRGERMGIPPNHDAARDIGPGEDAEPQGPANYYSMGTACRLCSGGKTSRGSDWAAKTWTRKGCVKENPFVNQINIVPTVTPISRLRARPEGLGQIASLPL